ncbi:Arc family DNA-binding protein [Pinisolibacter sp.]|uniref:Arc family DNA-binding protein n=1 Tax=Pinisolibacter sp. TaxID=2172024 RepID=UPI002FDEF104
MSQNPPDMKIRLSAELRRKVEDAARQNNRTLNSEIVFRLEHSFGSEPSRLKRRHWSKIEGSEANRCADDSTIVVLDVDGDGYADAILSMDGKHYSFKVKAEKE